MKKIACLLACCCVLSLGTLTASAKESAVRVSEDKITLAQTQTTFEAVIEVEPENAYAGVEIGVACPEGITVTDSFSSVGGTSVGPVLANGLYWSGFFESDNDLSGTTKITLQLSCPESFNSGDIQLKEVKVQTKNGVSVDTEKISPALEISIKRNSSGTTGSGSTGSELTSSEPTGSESTGSESTGSESTGSESTGSEPTTSTPSGENTNPDTNTSSTGIDSGIGGEGAAQTGDSSFIPMGIVLMSISGCIVLGMILLIIKKKKFD